MFGKARQATKFYGRVRICFVSHQANCTVESVKIKTGLNLKTGIKLKLIRVKEGLRSYFVLGEWGEGRRKGNWNTDSTINRGCGQVDKGGSM